MKKILSASLKLIKIAFPFILFFGILLFIVKFLSNSLANKILDYLKVIIWPFVVLIFVFSFKTNIAKFIDEISELNIFGNMAKRDQPTLTQNPPHEDVPEVIKESAELKTEEIKKEIKTKTTAEDQDNQKKILILQVAELQTALLFERIYNIIFGSQIKLLESLIINGSAGILYEDIAAYYQGVKAKWPNLNSYPLENYLGYLMNSGLIILFSEGIQKKYKVTPLGIDFIEYINKLNYIKEKSS